MRKLARFLKPYKLHMIVGPVLKLTEAVFELIVPVVMARIIDNGVNTGDVDYIWRMGGVLLLLGAVGLACALVCQRVASVASQGFGTEVRGALFRHINTLSHAELDRFGTSSLITRITNDVNQLQYAVAMLIRLVSRAPFLIIGAVAAAMMIDLKLSLVFIAVAPLVSLALYLVMSRMVPYYRSIQKKLDRVSLLTRENLEGTRVIRAFSRQEQEEARFGEACSDLSDTSERAGKISALLNPMTSVIMNLGVVAIIWFGGLRVDSGALTQGEIIAFVNYLTQISLALVVVANLVVTFTKAFASAGRVNEVFDTRPSVRESPGAAPPAPVAGAPRIEFDGVAFGYHRDAQPAVEGLSFAVLPGETLGIIGATGSGKSTVVNLMPRFYDATDGTVLIDGVDVRRYPLSDLRAKFGIVPQAASLVSGTIESNLRWGGRTATEEELWEALEIAQAKDFVQRLPQRLQAPVAQGGRNFSGGQRQRLTIARAFAGKPQILILDDSASALDYATDAALRAAIREKSGAATVVIVSQRANTVRAADRILVLKEGRMAGLGTHQELFETCAEYREICLSQMSEAEANLNSSVLRKERPQNGELR